MAGKGLDITPIRWPEKYDAAWFERFFRETVGPLADARNAIAGPGIAISASPTEPPTIAGSADVQALVTASLVTVLPESELPHTRQLAGEAGIIEIIDGGDGEPVTIALQSIPLSKLQRIPGLSVLGSTVSGDPDEFVPAAITAGSNDLILARVSDELLFSQLTSGMFPSEVVPDAALSANVALYDDDVGQFSSGTFADARIAESNVTQHQAALAIDWSQLTSVPAFGDLAFLDEDELDVFTDTDQGVVPASGGGTDNFLRADGTWAEPAGSGLPPDPDADALLMWDDGDGAAEWVTEIADSFLSDNVPLKDAANEFTATQEIASTSPRLRLNQTNAGTDEKITELLATSGLLAIASRNDSGSGGANLILAERDGTTWDSLALAATAITLNGVNVTDYARLSQANQFAGITTFTASGFGQSSAVRVVAPSPSFYWSETDQEGSNEGGWAMWANGGDWFFGTRNSAGGFGEVIAQVDRTGVTVDSVNFPNGQLQYDGLEVANQESGSFTATLTGMSGTVTGTIQWRRTGNKVLLSAPSAITGTSNNAAMTLTGLPAAIQPVRTQNKPCGRFTDNAIAGYLGEASFAAGSGTVTLGFWGTSGAVVGVRAFTGSGTKGLTAGWSVEYDLT